MPAGEFHAFRIKANGWNKRSDVSLQISIVVWIAPGLNFYLKRELMVRIPGFQNKIVTSDRSELVSMRQKTVPMTLG